MLFLHFHTSYVKYGYLKKNVNIEYESVDIVYMDDGVLLVTKSEIIIFLYVLVS